MRPVLVVSLSITAALALAGVTSSIDQIPVARDSYTDSLSTGLHLDATGDVIDLGSMPLAMAIAPGGDRAAVVLSGWREQGVQIVDLKSHPRPADIAAGGRTRIGLLGR